MGPVAFDCSCYCFLRLTLASPCKQIKGGVTFDHVLFDGSPLTFILISGVQGSPCLIAPAAAIAIIHNRNGISIMGKTDNLYEYIKSHNGYFHSKVCSMIP